MNEVAEPRNAVRRRPRITRRRQNASRNEIWSSLGGWYRAALFRVV